MKKLYILLAFSFFIMKAEAQWVTIPDTAFVTFLQFNYPTCMNGNQMDTTCSGIVNATTVYCINKNISNLFGIQYFDNLTLLNCTNNNLTSLPILPDSLLYLTYSSNQITSSQVLPNNLINLNCSGNSLFVLPILPSSLTLLDCSGNQLSNLPVLPLSLTSLTCSYNQLTSLPILPNTLIYLACDQNLFNSLTSLTNTSLTNLKCDHNLLTSLPQLPNGLKTLTCEYNQLSTLPSLPYSLELLLCSFNQITSLPTLPNSLINFWCNYNQLTSLPSLPNILKYLWCADNQITSLPSLPNSLKLLVCDDNQLVSLPVLPDSLNYLNCTNNQLTYLPELPDSLRSLNINNNLNLTCLPLLKKISYEFHYYSTGIQCLPNYPQGPTDIIPSLSTYPLCGVFNSNGCDPYWNISGKVYNDNNGNCVYDSSEIRLQHIKLNLFQNGNLIQQVYTGTEALYSFDTNTGTYTYTVDTTRLPLIITCPVSGSNTSLLTNVDSMDYDMDFGMHCKPGFDAGVNYIVNNVGPFVPGSINTISVGAGDMTRVYGLSCSGGISGNVIVNISGPVTYTSPATGAISPTVSGQTLTYTIADFGALNFNSDFSFNIKIDTSAQSGDLVCFDVTVNPFSGDHDTSNNTLQNCFTVVNSYDPNAKEVYPNGAIAPDQEWLTYTVHFQNTGTAPAQHIYVMDTLDQNLIASTFTLLSYSHEPLTQVFGNVVKFSFPNINLADSTSNEPNSHGYVQYKIKPMPNLPNNTAINNTAYIYFDFNSPVATNTAQNTVTYTGINETVNNDFYLYPNPGNETVNITFSSNIPKELSLYNVLGQQVFRKDIKNNKLVINTSNLTEGIYFLKGDNTKAYKLVVQH